MAPPPSPSPPPDPKTTVLAFLAHLQSLPPTYDTPILPILHLTSATLTPTPTITLTLTIPTTLCNAAGNLHGGATATIFDLGTSLALALVGKKGWWERTGVSRTLDVVFLEGVGVGEKVEVEGAVVRVGRRLGKFFLDLDLDLGWGSEANLGCGG